MIIKCTSFQQMAYEIHSENMSIVVLGAGVLGTITTSEILNQYQLLEKVLFYIDNNTNIQRQEVIASDRNLKVKAVETLNTVHKKIVVIIAVSRFMEVLEQLNGIQCMKNTVCYIMPMMCIHNFCSNTSQGVPILADRMLIPKKIHYMWLGKKRIPESLQKCIDSWKKYCPDYEIIRWDESNYDISKNDYMKQAYEAKAYGFVPDYARLDILYHYGGIYMDTDVEVIRSLDDMLCQQAFCGVEKWQTLNFGGCSGAVKGHQAVRKFLDAREHLSFFNKDGKQNRNTCGFYDTRVALKNGYIINGRTQNVMNMNIYAFDYFHVYDYMSGQKSETEHTYSVHWFNGGWLDENMRQANADVSKKYNIIYRQCVMNQQIGPQNKKHFEINMTCDTDI